MKTLASVLLAAALSAPPPAAAQSFTVGVKVGLNHAAWTGDFGTGSNPFAARTGPVAGASFTVGIKEVVAIDIEALYSQEGATGPGAFRMDIGYLETPILVKLALPLAGIPIRPMILAGIAPAWEISCSAMAQPMTIPEAPPPAAVSTSCAGWRTERRDFSEVLAGGVEVPTGRLRLTAELRYTGGRSNIAAGYAPLSTYNRVWSFMVGTALAM